MESEDKTERETSGLPGDFNDISLETVPSDLQEQMESDEDELPPPEDENEAGEINTGTVFAVIFLAVVIVIMVVMFLGGGRKKKESSQKELDKAGVKTEYQFKTNEMQNNKEAVPEEDVTDKNVDEILETLPGDLQLGDKTPPQSGTQPVPGIAPVSSVSGGNYKSDRPDTRNSKSPRRIDGLEGQPSPDTNQNIVSSVINGAYSSSAQRQQMSKEEYAAQMMGQLQSMQNRMYGGNVGTHENGFGNQSASYQQNKEEFYSNGNGSGASGQYLSYNSLWDGTVISGALITAIDTDNPGVVIARVTENVYSSYDHSFLLIPEGSLLYATYNSSVSYGQDKVQVAWNLLIRPDGYRITLGNMNGVSPQGASGYKGSVSNHPWETLKALGMTAIYSLIQTEAVNDINSENNEYLKNAMTDVYAQSSKIGNRIVDRALDIKPTIRIKAGTEVKLITNTPLELPPVKINQVTKKYVRTR